MRVNSDLPCLVKGLVYKGIGKEILEWEHHQCGAESSEQIQYCYHKMLLV